MTKKYNENVLVFPASLLDTLPTIRGGIRPLQGEGERWLDTILDNASFLDRNLAENDPSYKQIIPYVVLKHRGKYLTYKRGESGGESRLHAKYSIGVGGHVNDESDLEPPMAFYSSILRELDEEFELDFDPMSLPRLPLAAIYDESDDVGRVHFGLVYLMDLDSDVVSPRETSQENPTFYDIYQLNNVNLENWSRLTTAFVL